MKPNYRKEWRWNAKHSRDFYYDDVRVGYFRTISTFQEMRRNVGDRTDYRNQPHVDVKRGRGRTESSLNAWSIEAPVSRQGRSWKAFTKHEKQWMVGSDPLPRPSKPCRFWDRLVAMGLEHYDH